MKSNKSQTNDCLTSFCEYTNNYVHIRHYILQINK